MDIKDAIRRVMARGPLAAGWSDQTIALSSFGGVSSISRAYRAAMRDASLSGFGGANMI